MIVESLNMEQLEESANMREIRGFVELMKFIESEVGLVESSKPLLNYMEFLINTIDEKDRLISSLRR